MIVLWGLGFRVYDLRFNGCVMMLEFYGLMIVLWGLRVDV